MPPFPAERLDANGQGSIFHLEDDLQPPLSSQESDVAEHYPEMTRKFSGSLSFNLMFNNGRYKQMT